MNEETGNTGRRVSNQATAAILIVATVSTVLLGPTMAHAATRRYAADGAICNERYSEDSLVGIQHDPQRGSLLEDRDDNGASLGGEWICPIPLGPATVELDSTNGVKLDHVGIRFYTECPGEIIDMGLWAHAYDSSAYCLIDDNFITAGANGYQLMTLTYGTACDEGGPVSASWNLNVYILMDDAVDHASDAIRLKLITVFS